MTLIERYYSCVLVEVPVEGGGILQPTGLVPSIASEPMLAPGFAERGFNGDSAYLVAADEAGWAEFDALYPNQSATTGGPYRRRYPTTGLPDIEWGVTP
jgi:hypothetical protein